MIQLQIENTSTCNAKCGFCVYPQAERWGGNMSMDLYRKILDDAATVPLITMVCITGLGEPTLDKDLVERVRYARSRKPKAFIDIFTNGVFLTPEKFAELQAAGLSSIQVSLNAVRPEQHDQIMGLKGKFEKVCANLDSAWKNQTTCRVQARAVINGDSFTNEDGHAFYGRWGMHENGGIGSLIREGNWAGAGRTIRKFKPNEACHRALSQIYVMFDGRVTTCCFDPSGKQIFGDLNHQTLREVYADTGYLAFREAHSKDEADKYPICAGCTRI